MPPLTELRMEPLHKALIGHKQPQEYYQQNEELGILRIDRTTFWVFDKATQMGYYVSEWKTAEKLLFQLEATTF